MPKTKPLPTSAPLLTDPPRQRNISPDGGPRNMTSPDLPQPPERLALRVRGRVQGVGFRPAVYRIARKLGLGGHVGNDEQGVFIEIEGPAPQVATFQRRLRDAPPPWRGSTPSRPTLSRPEATRLSGSPPAPRHPRPPPKLHPMPPPAPTASPRCAPPTTADTDTRSSTAPTAAHDTPSSPLSPTTAPTPPCAASRCAPTAVASTRIPPTGASMPNPSHAQSAARASGLPTGPETNSPAMPSRKRHDSWKTAGSSPSRDSAASISRAAPIATSRSPSCANEKGATPSLSPSWSAPSKSPATYAASRPKPKRFSSPPPRPSCSPRAAPTRP